MSLDHPARMAGEGALAAGAILYPWWAPWFDSPEAHAVTWVAGMVALALLIWSRALDVRKKRAELRRIEGGGR